jgi:excisionase family DNA binding protein
MSEEVYTVEQFAERLKLHPKTVLRFIREGRLRAVKVGKSYRILRTEMEAMTGISPATFQSAISAYQGVIEGRTGARGARLGARVTSIVDLSDIAPDTAQRMARMLSAARMGQDAHADPMSLDVVHDPANRTLKIIVVASLGDTATMLKMVEVLTQS